MTHIIHKLKWWLFLLKYKTGRAKEGVDVFTPGYMNIEEEEARV